jgi:thiol-disulfide isomerase/thioredoxin
LTTSLSRRAFVGAALALFAAPAPAVGRLERWTRGATPPLALRDEKRIEHRLADYRGRALLINFWATWCEPCRDEMPSIVKLAERFAGRPFAAVAVNVGEGEAATKKFFSSVALDASRLVVLYDRDMAVSRAWGATLLPSTYLVDSSGRIRQWLRGEADWTAAASFKAVESLLPG